MTPHRACSFLVASLTLFGHRGRVAQPGPKTQSDRRSTTRAGLRKGGGSAPNARAFAMATADPDGRVAERALFEGWDNDPAWGEKTALELMQGGDAMNRVLGAVALAPSGRSRTPAEIIKMLRENDSPDERRVLVRAIGTRVASRSKKVCRSAPTEH